MKLILWLSFVALCACASSHEANHLPDSADVDTNADPAAYGADTMTFRKDMPKHDAKPWEFYYKHCSTNGSSDIYSANAYDCTGPAW
jgi:hypothetical protein